MIVSGRNVIGLNVVTIDDGSVIQSVDDVAYNPTTQRVEALLVDSGGLFRDAKAIDMDDVKNIGENAVIVHDASVIKPVGELAKSVNSISDANKYLVRTKVLTDEGKDLGTVSDLNFDSQTGAVDSLEVSQGGFKSKKFVKPADIVTIGKDATIVSAYTEEKFEEQAAKTGMTGFVNEAKEQISNKTNDFTEAVRDGAAEVKVTAEDQVANIKDASNEAVAIAREKAYELREDAAQARDDVATRAREASEDVTARTQGAAVSFKEAADDAAQVAQVKSDELRHQAVRASDDLLESVDGVAMLAREHAERASTSLQEDVQDTTQRAINSRDELTHTESDINYIKENNMSGLSDKLGGKAKQAVGDLSSDDKLKAEGKAQEVKGDIKAKADEALDKASSKIDEIKDNLKKS